MKNKSHEVHDVKVSKEMLDIFFSYHEEGDFIKPKKKRKKKPKQTNKHETTRKNSS